MLSDPMRVSFFFSSGLKSFLKITASHSTAGDILSQILPGDSWQCFHGRFILQKPLLRLLEIPINWMLNGEMLFNTDVFGFNS